jgi:hypothetical protein
MNAPTGKLTGVSEIDRELAVLYRLRSDMLDSFADIESALLKYIAESGVKICDTSPTGHKVEAAKKVPAGPRRSKELKARADAELSKLAELLKKRADIVHSRMEIAITIESKIIAIFKNAKCATADEHFASVFTLAEMRHFVLTLQNLRNALQRALTAKNPAVAKTANSK